MRLKRGTLISLEGIDGAGTTTQGRLLCQWLESRGEAVHLTCEPSGGPVGRLIREVLHEAHGAVPPAVVALLFAADRVDHLEREVEQHLAAGACVVTDRYVYSSFAYQGLELDRDWVAEINCLAAEPDLTIYLRTHPDLALVRRLGRGGARELFETEAFQQRVSAAYDALFGATPNSGTWALDGHGAWSRQAAPPSDSPLSPARRGGAWAVLDGALPVDQVQDQLRSLVRAHLEHEDGDRPLRRET